jgi:hypothetical protein
MSGRSRKRNKDKSKSAPTTPEQHQEVDFDEEGEEAEEKDQQDEQVSVVSLQKEVKDLSVKLNQVLGAVAKLTKQTSVPGILQEAADAQSAPDRASGDSISSESTVPVYSGDRLALFVKCFRCSKSLMNPIKRQSERAATVEIAFRSGRSEDTTSDVLEVDGSRVNINLFIMER